MDVAQRAGQATLVLPCGATKTLCVAPGLAVDRLLSLAADTIAAAAGAHKSGAHPAAAGPLLLRCDGRLLRDGGETLAEAGVTGGSRIEVLWAVGGGMPAKHSQGELDSLVQKTTALLREGGFEGPITSTPVTGGLRIEALFAPVAVPSEDKLSEGCIVEICGLVSAAHHNGRKGRLLNFQSDKGRWVVKLASDGELLSMKPANLILIKFRSITRSNLESLVQKAEALIRKVGYTGLITSHAVRGLFRNVATDAEGNPLSLLGGKPVLDKDGEPLLDKKTGKPWLAYPEHAPFHPQEMWPENYSEKIAKCTITYTWLTDLNKDLTALLDEAERRLVEEERGEATWWLDIFFNDQNVDGGGMKVQLAKAERNYRRAECHLVFLRHGTLLRAWCNAEILYRLQVLPPCRLDGGMTGAPCRLA